VRVCPWGLREGILLRRLEICQPELDHAGWVPCGSSEDRRDDFLSRLLQQSVLGIMAGDRV